MKIILEGDLGFTYFDYLVHKGFLLKHCCWGQNKCWKTSVHRTRTS